MPWHRLLHATLGDSALGGNQAFVYVIVGMAGKGVVFYVGQTRQRMGAIGRLAEHLSDGGNSTFRHRARAITREEICGKVEFSAIVLSGDTAFQQSSPDYREAVECVIERELREFVVDQGLYALSVARVRQHPYQRSPLVVREASRYLPALQEWLRGAILSVRVDGE